VQVSCGTSHVLALDDRGRAWGWGHSGGGRLGDGITRGTTDRPVRVTLEPAAPSSRLPPPAVAAGAEANGGGFWQTPAPPQAPAPVFQVDTFAHVAAGGPHSALVGTDGALYVAGSEFRGRSSERRCSDWCHFFFFFFFFFLNF
jgi:hypothetical protein